MKIRETAKPKKLRKLLAILVAMGFMSFAGVNVANADDYPITNTTSLNTFLGQGAYFSGKVQNSFDLDDYIIERYIAGATTIDGGNFTISGSNTYNGFRFSDSSATETTIKNLTIKNMTSASANGAAIYNGSVSALTIDHVTFNNNYTTDAGGGAIYNAGGTSEKSVSITNSTFYGNYNTVGGEESGEDSMEDAGGSNSSPIGGAIYNASNSYMNISDSNFEGNGYKDYGVKGAQELTQYGGAIYNEGNLTLSGNTFTTNVATSDGGAIYNKDGATITLSGTNTFTSNSVLNNNGGAIYNKGNMSISGATFGGDNESDGNTASYGGAIYNNGGTSEKPVSISNALFKNNSATEQGGAIYNVVNMSITDTDFKGNYTTGDEGTGGAINNNGYISITGGTFEGNGYQGYTDPSSPGTESTIYGGAIYNTNNLKISGTTFETNVAYIAGAIGNDNGYSIDITNSKFKNNKATSDGGAIDNYSGLDNTLSGIEFENNSASNGGAISNAGYSTSQIGIITLTGTNTFTGNTATSGNGGAIYNYNSFGKIDLSGISTFTGNTATSGNGGAIYNAGNMSISGATFGGDNASDGNTAYNAGAIYNGATLEISDSTFANNKATCQGGAIHNNSLNLTISNTIFKNNVAEGTDTTSDGGGAIYNTGGTTDTPVRISDATFENNTANQNGGAIYNLDNHETINLSGTNTFTGNTATHGNGGAIYNNGIINLTGTNTFTGNKANESSNDIHNEATLNINGGTTTINGGISGTGNTYINGGTLVLGSNATLQQNVLGFYGGTLDLRNNKIQDLSFLYLEVVGTSNIYVDADLAKGQMDTLNSTYIAGDTSTGDIGTLNVAGINLLSDATKDSTTINFTSTADLMSHVTYSGGQVAYSPIYKYDVNYDNTTGNFTFARLGGGGGGGNDPEIYNPAILPSPVSSQVAGYTTMVESFNQGFNFVDNFMGMTKAERMAYRDRNKYALLDHTPQYTGSASKSLWVMPYTSFENVKLNNGPDIDAITYGTYFGGDSELYSLSHGWEAVYSLFAGYNGAYQTFGGVNMNYNGGSLGAAATFFKGNFFTAIDVAVGGGVSTANTMFGMENATLLSAGGALKAGYNFEFKEGRHIIQPSLLVGYSFTNTFDYTNAAGIDITSDPLHAIILQPQIKYIMNLKNGWQPYAAVSMVFNIMDKSKFYAQDIALPEMSMKPYVQYGLGVQKKWGERCTGYVQAMVRNGGRNGVALSLGFKWQLGKGSSNSNL